jgi:acyl carrier protein
MTKEEVIAVIKKNAIEVLGDVDPKEISATRNFRDFGADSLDIIEVVALSMDDLGIKIPRSELMDITTIDELGDRFLRFLKEEK